MKCFMMSLSDDKQADIIGPFNIVSRYLDDILNINNRIWQVKYTLQRVNLIKSIPQILKPQFWICICPFLMTLCLPKFYDCQFPIIYGNVSHSTSCGVYISQLISFAGASSHVADFNTRKTLS